MRISFLFFFSSLYLAADETRINNLYLDSPPSWVNLKKAEKTVDQVENLLEWQIRKIKVSFKENPNPFVEAFTFKKDQSIQISPKIKPELFYAILAHELTHVILYQKYKESVPDWLNEGLANFISAKISKRLGLESKAPVNYTLLKTALKEKALHSIEALAHPLNQKNSTKEAVYLRYQASTALMDMLSKKCDVFDLLQLSVQKKLEVYIQNTCGIADLSQDFQRWISSK